MTIKEKLERWRNTGECDMLLEDLCFALGKYESLIDSARHLPHMEIVIEHSISEANRIRDIIRARDRRNN